MDKYLHITKGQELIGREHIFDETLDHIKFTVNTGSPRKNLILKVIQPPATRVAIICQVLIKYMRRENLIVFFLNNPVLNIKHVVLYGISQYESRQNVGS